VHMMTETDEKWLDLLYLRELEHTRLILDLDGWVETPVVTFSAGVGAAWVEGDVTDSDRGIAAAIRERVRGRQHSRGQL